MADFLSRLTERTLGLADVARPRITPLFASPSSIATREVPELIGEVVMDESRRASPRRDASPRPPLAAADSTISSTPAPAVANAPLLTQPLVATDRPIPNQARPEESAPPAATQPGSETERPQNLRRHIGRSEGEPMHTELLPAPAKSSTEDRAGDAPLVALRPDRTATRSQRIAAADSRRPAARLEEPAVNVTIGRIEVRAVFPTPEPARPPARPAPELTIEEYIKQRREGRR